MIVIAIAWVPRLFAGFWLDETYTFWQAYRGWRPALEIGAYVPSQSALYAVVTSFFYFGPGKHMEFLLRLPSCLAMLAAGYFLFRLAERWFGKNAGWLALVLFVSERSIIRHATEARPYAMALAACIGLMYGLDAWLCRKRLFGWILFIVCAILIPYIHCLFCVFLLTPAAYIVIRRLHGLDVPWVRLTASGTLVLAALLPLRSHVVALLAQAHILSVAALPSPDDLLKACFPPSLIAAGFLAVAAGELILGDWFGPAEEESRRMALVAVFWALSGPVVLFVASLLKGYGLLVERYMFYAVVGLILFSAYFFARLRTYAARIGVLTVFALVCLSGAAKQLQEGGPLGRWRTTLERISRIDPNGTAPVLVASGFVQANSMDWEHSLNAGSYLYAPLLAYPIRNRTFPLPCALDDRARNYAGSLFDGELHSWPHIILVAVEPSDLTNWITWQLSQRHYQVHSESRSNTLSIMLFQR